MEIGNAHWVHKDINYFGEIVSHECACSSCGYVAMRYSHMIQDFRAGKPFAMPNYKYCPNCAAKMEEEK